MRRLVVGIIAALSAGCSTEAIDPLTRPLAGGPPPADAGIDVTEPPDATPPGPVKRTVSMRNPWGEPAGNLLVDGDFELSTAPEGRSGQYGWLGFSQSSEKSLKNETGGICRTGLRCAVLEPNTFLFGRGAAASGERAHVLSMFAKVPPPQACKSIVAYAVICDTTDVLKKLTADDATDEQGWCELSATLPPLESAICLFIDGSDLRQAALLDSAVLLPDDGSAAASGELAEPTPAQRQRFATIRDHRRRRFGSPAPEPIESYKREP
jgi:hypothetical protein